MSLLSLAAGDVLDAFVEFSDGSGYKRRPVIVVTATKHEVLALRCTTNLSRNPSARLVVVEWESAGLARPTAVDIRTPVRISRLNVVRRWGSLAMLDLARLEARGGFTHNTDLAARPNDNADR